MVSPRAPLQTLVTGLIGVVTHQTTPVHLLPSTSTAGTGVGSGSASAQRNANLNISGSGFLVISADYAINAAISGNSCNDYFWYCSDPNSASFDLSTNFSGNYYNSSHSALNINLIGNPLLPVSTSDHKEGILSVGVMVNNGDILNFSSAVNAAAHDNGLSLNSSSVQAIPVQEAMWLFSSALIGLIGLGRRKQAVME
jgi:hypothetical protein